MNMCGRYRQGSVLVYSMILLSMLLSSGLALSILATTGAQTTRELVNSIPAFYAAESCLEQSLRQYVVLGLTPDLSTAGFSNETLTFSNDATCERSFQYEQSPPTTPPTPTTTKSMTVSTRGVYKQSGQGLSVTITR